MVSINYFGSTAFYAELNSSVTLIKDEIKQKMCLTENDYYLIRNGKRFTYSHITEECEIHIVPKLIGGKGGFGSMLRAIGAQIEKTTNREACRDLSGRRLRDINEEKRLKTWMAQQIEREKEADDRRQKKLERLCQTPKHEFKDENYEKERSVLTEKVEDALEQGLKASSSSTGKRKHEEEKSKVKKKKIWLGSDDELSSSSDVDSEEETKAEYKKIEEDEKLKLEDKKTEGDKKLKVGNEDTGEDEKLKSENNAKKENENETENKNKEICL